MRSERAARGQAAVPPPAGSGACGRSAEPGESADAADTAGAPVAADTGKSADTVVAADAADAADTADAGDTGESAVTVDTGAAADAAGRVRTPRTPGLPRIAITANLNNRGPRRRSPSSLSQIFRSPTLCDVRTYCCRNPRFTRLPSVSTFYIFFFYTCEKKYIKYRGFIQRIPYRTKKVFF